MCEVSRTQVRCSIGDVRIKSNIPLRGSNIPTLPSLGMTIPSSGYRLLPTTLTRYLSRTHVRCSMDEVRGKSNIVLRTSNIPTCCCLQHEPNIPGREVGEVREYGIEAERGDAEPAGERRAVLVERHRRDPATCGAAIVRPAGLEGR